MSHNSPVTVSSASSMASTPQGPRVSQPAATDTGEAHAQPSLTHPFADRDLESPSTSSSGRPPTLTTSSVPHRPHVPSYLNPRVSHPKSHRVSTNDPPTKHRLHTSPHPRVLSRRVGHRAMLSKIQKRRMAGVPGSHLPWREARQCLAHTTRRAEIAPSTRRHREHAQQAPASAAGCRARNPGWVRADTNRQDRRPGSRDAAS